jgi:signal transduction histidine kinase/DNA-binding response OmpR family regulator/ligand-binding sensor domain-containing protein
MPQDVYSQLDGAATYLETGLPFIQNFSPNDYGGAHAQNWAVLQDNRGIMYFANSIGILEFDGVSWRLISMTTTARSLTMDENGTIYVGGRGEFGYLAPDSIGALQFVSLVEKIPEAYRDFSEVWQMSASQSAIYMRTREFLFRWRPKTTSAKPKPIMDGELKIWRPQTQFSRLFVFGDTVLVHQPDIGLMQLTEDSLQIVPNGDRFSEIPIRLMLAFPGKNPNGKETFLLCTRENGFFLFDMQTLKPFPVDAAINKFLDTRRLYHGAVLPDNTIALASSDGGLAVMDTAGHLQTYINQKSGLRSESVHFVYTDRQGGMWLALNNGIARIEYPAPFSYFNEQSGLQGNIDFIQKYDGRLYLGGNTGVYMLSESRTADGLPAFEQILNVGSNTGSFLPDNKTLLVSARDIYRIEKNKTRLSFDLEKVANVMAPSRFRPDIVFVGLISGLAILKKVNESWQIAGLVAGVKTDVRSIVEAAPDELWLGNMNAGFSHIKIPGINTLIAGGEQQQIPATIKEYGDSLGVPVGTGRVSRVAGKVIFATNGGLRRFDAQRDLFLPDSTWGSRFADSTRMVSHIVEDSRGNVWLKSTRDRIRETAKGVRGNDGKYTWDSTPFRRIADWGSVYALYPDPDEPQVLWIGSPSGLLRYDEGVAKNYQAEFHCLLRKVIVNGDSTIFAGVSAADESALPTFNYADHNLRFQFAATSFEVPSANHYQFFLDGFDEDWGNWTEETQKDYTNIPEGEYTFRVRARNVYEHLSAEDIFAFAVRPPWFRTWWAYAFYGLVFLGILYAVRRYEMSRQQFKHEAELQRIEAEQLQETDMLKSRFFANISHEFRTPLTLIMGQIDQLQTMLKEQGVTSRLEMVSRNARHLLRLINQLLDLSKFEAGQMTLLGSRQNIVPLLRQLTSAFESMAAQKHITLSFESQPEEIFLFYEQDKIEKILYNLLSNALKFTPEQGQVRVKVEIDDSEAPTPDEETGELKVTVRDSGVGIAKEQLPFIFDRFYQVDASMTRLHEGTGIGLALTKELVQIHGGGISVTSEEGFGTTFVVRLPLGKAHLKPEQIMELAGAETLTGFQTLSELASAKLAPEAPESQSSSTPAAGDFMLIVEDNPDMRLFIRESLEDGYRVVEAANGEEGFAKAQEIIPDIIITDVMMPGIDGYELTRRLRQEQVTSHIPIIMLTARAADEDRFEGLEQGVDAYLTKPFNKKELRIRVRKLIEMRRQLLAQVRQKPMISASEVMVTSAEQKFLQRLQEIVEDNISDETFEMEELGRKIGMSPRQLQRKINALLGCSPAFYIRRIRLERGRQLLEKGAGGISEVAFEVGYGSGSAFARAFRDAFGKPPSEFVKKLDTPGKK